MIKSKIELKIMELYQEYNIIHCIKKYQFKRNFNMTAKYKEMINH